MNCYTLNLLKGSHDALKMVVEDYGSIIEQMIDQINAKEDVSEEDTKELSDLNNRLVVVEYLHNELKMATKTEVVVN